VTVPAPQVLTNSRLACFRACPRRHYLRYELGLRPAEQGLALRVGSAFHRALEAHAKGQDVEAALAQGIDDPFDLALVAAMFDGHQRRWADEPLEVLASELAFDLPLKNPDTGAATPIFRIAGVIDAIVRLPDGRLALKEVKTTSRDFAPGADYWTRLHLDPQLSIYVLAARELGYPVETVLYDVTRRPALKPLKATPAEDRKYLQKDSKQKDGTVRPAGSLYAGQRDTDESPEEFAGRIAAAIAAEPDRHFARIEIARLDQDLEECARDVWRLQRVVRDCQLEAERAVARGQRPTVAWAKSPDACMGNGVTCEFLAVCQSGRRVETETPEGFIRVTDLHPELTNHATEPGLSGSRLEAGRVAS
jgi:hypothetical protein